MNRGGRGTNQYGVKPRTGTSDVDDLVAKMNSVNVTPEQRSADVAYVDGDVAYAIRQGDVSSLSGKYPKAYLDALGSDQEVRDDALGVDEMDHAMLAERIQSRDSSMSPSLARMYALSVVHSRDLAESQENPEELEGARNDAGAELASRFSLSRRSA